MSSPLQKRLSPTKRAASSRRLSSSSSTSTSSMAMREREQQSQHQKKTNAIRRRLGTLRRSLSGKKLGNSSSSSFRKASVRQTPASLNGTGGSSNKRRLTPTPEKSCSQTFEAELSSDESDQRRKQQQNNSTTGASPQETAPSTSSSPEKEEEDNESTSTTISKPQVRELERVRKAAEALDKAGNDLFDRGQYNAAMASYTRALKLKRRMLTLMANIKQNNKKGSTIEAYQQVLLGSVATSINNIGYLRQRNGASKEETMAAYQDSLQIKREILGNKHLGVGKTLNNIGSVYFSERMYQRALCAYKESLEILQTNLGPNHLDVATVHSNIGDVYLATRKADKARMHYKDALSMRWHLGEHHPKCIRLMEKIASIEMVDIDIELFRASLERGVSVEGLSGETNIQTELHHLHDEVERDIAHVSTVEREMRLDMVRDKISMIRGMRELMGDLSSPSHHLRPIHPANGTPRTMEPLPFGRSRSTTPGSTSPELLPEETTSSERAHSVPTTPAARASPPPPRSSLTPTRPLTPMERNQALLSVKSRLSRLRSERGLMDSSSSRPSSSRPPSTSNNSKSSSPRNSTTTLGSSRRSTLSAASSVHSSSSSLLEEGMEALRLSSMDLGPPTNLATTLDRAMATTTSSSTTPV